ncbi:g1979 [Coccomyxa viridis]|uniref:Menin n=1 Tax=Coccomyxa viridis TaxID=1274662 RepID=A0ABP1FPH9_9CHLO
MLGLYEVAHTAKQPLEPSGSLQGDQQACQDTFDTFVDQLRQDLHSKGRSDTRAKVKLVADAIWAKLSGVFSKEVLHAQHVSVFCHILQGKYGKGKRQLDCAGVVTTTLAAVQRLATHEEHADLCRCRLQVSEDHCWISTGPAREDAIEVTTDTAAKRGLAPSAEAWAGWLYNGGHAIMCSPQMAVTALVASLNPAIVARQNTGTDSAEVQELQKQLLEMIHRDFPQAMYPAAICALADLKEIDEQDALNRLIERDTEEAATTLSQDNGLSSAKSLFTEAIERASAGEEGACGYQWYVYSYQAGYLLRRAAFMLEKLGTQPGASEQAMHLIREAAALLGSRGSAVLQKYRYCSADGELYKDVEGVLEGLCNAISLLHGHLDQLLQDTALAQGLLQFWDGICCLLSAQAKPNHWLQQQLKALKLFEPEARSAAAGHVLETSSSIAMRKTAGMWGALKPAPLRMIFGMGDVEDLGRQVKRPKR